jgi:hypothetical protein
MALVQASSSTRAVEHMFSFQGAVSPLFMTDIMNQGHLNNCLSVDAASDPFMSALPDMFLADMDMTL